MDSSSGVAAKSNGSSSTSLIRRVRQRDPQAWVQLTELYGPLVYHWCRRFGCHDDSAADVFQEVFAAVATGIDRFEHDPGRGTFRGWLRTITLYKVRDVQRSSAGEPQALGGSEAQQWISTLRDPLSEDADDESDRAQLSALFRRGLNQVRDEFEPRTWQAFWRTAVEGELTADVADDLGITSNGVRQARSRVLRRLRQQLGDLAE